MTGKFTVSSNCLSIKGLESYKNMGITTYVDVQYYGTIIRV